jgi:hypothetical protein
MSRTAKFLWALLSCVLAAATLGASDSVPHPTALRYQKSKKKPSLPSYSPNPLPPVPLDQTPAVPPQVNYVAGQLTIVADNCTLGDILVAVRTQTGINLDIPAGSAERVVTKLGPGSVHDVLASLLSGSHFNYVMLGSPNDPSAIQRLILTPAAALVAEDASALPTNRPEPSPVAQAQAQFPAQVQAQIGVPPVTHPPRLLSSPDMDGVEDQNPIEQDETAGDDPQQSPSEDPKTPEHLLQELQRQQQLQQQLQQQSQPGPAAVTPSPAPVAPPNRPQ